MRSIAYSLVFFVLFLSLLEARNKDEPTVITFHGNEVIDTSMLEALVGVDKPSFFAFWKEDVSTVNALLIPKLNDIFTLFYRQEGFYEANISHTIDASGIHFVIQENRPIRIEGIDLESDFPIKEAIKLKKGTRFRSANFSETKANIKKLLLNQGLCRHTLNAKAYIDLEKYTANIAIRLRKGDRCHFGKITPNSDQASSIDDEVIFSRLYFKEGEPFSLEKIRETYESLYALEAFDSLHIMYNAKYNREIPVDIKFRELESKTHSRIGVGYATDLKFQSKYHWEYKNFHGGARKLAFDLLYSTKQKWIENSFFNPAILSIGDYHLDFQNSVGYREERNIHDYDEKIGYDRVYLQHREDKWLHSVGLGVENREISDDRAFFLIYPFMKLIYDRRDSKINPQQGFYFAHEMEYGLPYSPDSTTYLKYIEELRAIYTLYDVTLSAVGRFGAIEVYKNRLPESKKFFAGGAFSNRAYGYERIGITDDPTKPSSLGGLSMANLSLEANFPLYKSLYFGVFNDNSMISENEKIWELSDRVVSSVGFGFRYMTPVGPFKLDFGFNIADYSENGFHFQVGQSF